MAKKVERWLANDGTEYATEREADNHDDRQEMETRIANALDEHVIYGKIEFEDLIHELRNNTDFRDALRKYLSIHPTF